MMIFVTLLAVAVLVHYYWQWRRLYEQGRSFPHPAEDPIALFLLVVRRLRRHWGLVAVLVGVWTVQGLVPMLWPVTSPLPGSSSLPGYMPSADLARGWPGFIPPGASVGQWRSPHTDEWWDWDRVRESFAYVPAWYRITGALPGVLPAQGWVHARDWLELALIASVLVVLGSWLVSKPAWLTAGTRRRLPWVFGFLLFALLLQMLPRFLLAPLSFRALYSSWWGMAASQLLTLPLIGLFAGMMAMTEGLLWAAAWRLIVAGRWQWGTSLSAVVKRFWSLWGFLLVCQALFYGPLLLSSSLGGLLTQSTQWLVSAGTLLGPLVPAALLFVPWALMRRPVTLRRAIDENFGLLRKHRRPLGWFFLRFAALMLLAQGIATALVKGLHPGLFSGFLGLAPTLLLWGGTLTVALLYAILTGQRIAPLERVWRAGGSR